MEIDIEKKVKVRAKTLKIHMKVVDEFEAQLLDQDGDVLKDYEGYVPGFMPGEHYGDYLLLDIDIDTGQITNWKRSQRKRSRTLFLPASDEAPNAVPREPASQLTERPKAYQEEKRAAE